MPTRAAAKREAAFLQQSRGAAILSSPPASPNVKNGAEFELAVLEKSEGFKGLVKHGVTPGTDKDQLQLPTPALTAKGKRKRASPRTKVKVEPVAGGWDVLPHGLGKKGDLVEGETTEELSAPPTKKVRRGKAMTISNGDDDVKKEDVSVKVELQSNLEEDKETNAGVEHVGASSRKTRRGRVQKSLAATSTDPVTAELLQTDPQKTRGRKTRAVKEEAALEELEIGSSGSVDESFEEQPIKKRANRKKPTIDTSKDVLDKVDELIDASGKVPKKERKGKANKYGLTPGYSPFPDFPKPTPEDCEEVTRLLSELHGAVKPPEVIPPPSMEVTGCGEVPDLLDAILRTLLSASTTAHNSNMALQGLKEKFGLRESGIGKGSVSWEAVHQAPLEDVIDSIKKGGLAKVKGANIKKILNAVFEQNLKRRDALMEEKRTGEPADIPGAKRETEEQKDLEIQKTNENMLSMDHVFEMTTEEAMEEMTKLPGIGVKTASCVILFCMKRPSFAVDTHVWRHCKWLGWVPEKATRDQTFSHCEVRVPDHLKYPLHRLFLRHGKTCGRCRANTHAGTEEWERTVCPIDHLVTRREGKKMGGPKPAKAAKRKVVVGKKKQKGKKRTEDDETDEEDVGLEEDLSDHEKGADDYEVDGFEDGDGDEDEE